MLKSDGIQGKRSFAGRSLRPNGPEGFVDKPIQRRHENLYRRSVRALIDLERFGFWQQFHQRFDDRLDRKILVEPSVQDVLGLQYVRCEIDRVRGRLVCLEETRQAGGRQEYTAEPGFNGRQYHSMIRT